MGTLYEFDLKTDKNGFFNITHQLNETIRNGGVENGVALIVCPHTTAALTLTENTDPKVGGDLLLGMERAFPESEDYQHLEGNSHAYLRSCNFGCQIHIIIDNGWPILGIWQNLFFVEFDGPRERKFYIKLIEC